MDNKKQLIESGKQILKLEKEIDFLKEQIQESNIQELQTKIKTYEEFIERLNLLLREYR